jgi:hypothetical protein
VRSAAGSARRTKGQEVENQLRQLGEFAIRSGWRIVAEYIDHESGKVSDSEQFQQMLRLHPRGNSTFCCSGRSTGSAAKAFCQHCSICNG